MRLLRHTSIIAIASIFLLLLIGSSFAACLVTSEVDCCADEHDCDDPFCEDGAICHCACAYSGILLESSEMTPIPTLSGILSCDPATAFVPQLSRDLFRPPRLS